MNKAQAVNLKDEKQLATIKEFGIQEITEKNLRLMGKQILEIPAIPENAKQYNSVKDMHISAKKILPRIEDRRVELKSPVLEKGRLIDATAKKAVSMVRPLIELSSERRFAWEKKFAQKKELEMKRLEDLDSMINVLEGFCASGQQYNFTAEDIQRDLEYLQVMIIEETYQERTQEAKDILIKGIIDTGTALAARIIFEDEQAKQKADRKKLADEKAEFDRKRVAEREKQARLDAERKEKADQEAKRLAKAKKDLEDKQKAAQMEADKKAEEQAKKLRLKEEQLEGDRKALEDYKKKIEAKEKAREDAKALKVQIVKCHSEALETHELYLAGLDDEIAAARREAISRWKLEEKGRKAKLKADRARVKLVKTDQKTIKKLANDLDAFISDIAIPKFKTKEAELLHLDLVTGIKRVIMIFDEAGKKLV